MKSKEEVAMKLADCLANDKSKDNLMVTVGKAYYIAALEWVLS
jgi:hypothetical protein